MNRNEKRSSLIIVLSIIILIILFKFLIWLFPFFLLLFIIYLIYHFIIRVKDKVNENMNNDSKKINSKKSKVMEGTIIREKNDD